MALFFGQNVNEMREKILDLGEPFGTAFRVIEMKT